MSVALAPARSFLHVLASCGGGSSMRAVRGPEDFRVISAAEARRFPVSPRGARCPPDRAEHSLLIPAQSHPSYSVLGIYS